MWLSELALDRRLARKDRNYKELKALIGAVEVGGGYDQLNVGVCMVFEVILRRAAAASESISTGVDRWTGRWQSISRRKLTACRCSRRPKPQKSAARQRKI